MTRRNGMSRLLVMVCAAALTMTGCAFQGLNSLPLPGAVGRGSDANTYHVEIANVATLESNSPVMISDVVVGSVGDLIFKPRSQWHTFWNAGDEPARLLEIISPAGFERFFAELVDLGGVTQVEPEAFAELCARYALEMNPDSVPELIERFGLRFPGEPI